MGEAKRRREAAAAGTPTPARRPLVHLTLLLPREVDEAITTAHQALVDQCHKDGRLAPTREDFIVMGLLPRGITAFVNGLAAHQRAERRVLTPDEVAAVEPHARRAPGPDTAPLFMRVR